MMSIVLALAAALPAASPPQAAFVVERGRVGPVSIGGAADSIYREFAIARGWSISSWKGRRTFGS